VNRSSVYLPKHGPAASSAAPELDEQIAGLLHELVQQQHPTFGYRRLWAALAGQGALSGTPTAGAAEGQPGRGQQ
jgi:hypothetical protein